MDRLDELEFCSCHCPYHGEPNGCNRPEGECQAYRQFLELKQFEEEMKKLSNMPCQIGDVFYRPWIGGIEEFTVSLITFTLHNGIKIRLSHYDSILGRKSSFEVDENLLYCGQPLYRDRDEAIEAYKKLKQEFEGKENGNWKYRTYL